MGYVGTKPTAAPLTSAQLEDGLVTAAKLATDAVETAKVKDLNVTVAKLPAAVDISTKTVTLPASVSGLGTGITNSQLAGSIDVTSKITGVVPAANLGSGSASASTYLAGNQTYQTITEYDDSVLQSNIAMLGFKVAVNGSLTRYNLVDQSIDEFYDTSGVDASASTNESRIASGSNYYYDGGSSTTPTITQDADSTGVDGLYSWYKWTDHTGTGSYNNDTTQSHAWMIVAGGGGSGGRQATAESAGAGGAGGYRAGTTLSLTGGNAYTITVGDGGAGAVNETANGSPGGDSIISGTGITTTTSDGGGYGAKMADNGGPGGSGGGASDNTYTGGSAIAITPYTAAGETTSVQGYAGGNSSYNRTAGGGGGASEVGEATPNSSTGGAGGDGLSNSIAGSAVYYAGGGGGGAVTTAGAAGNGGGGAGGAAGSAGTVGTDGLGGGAGGGDAQSVSYGGVDGGSGVVVLRRLTSIVTSGLDLTLQSTDVTAEASPTYGEFVTLIENAYGTATLNTDIKGYISRDSGSTFTQGTLVDEGTWGTNKKVLGFHDLTLGGAASTAMCYKITTHNQSAASKETRIYATSIGWR